MRAGLTDRGARTVLQSHTDVILRCSPLLCGEPRRMAADTGACFHPSRRRARARLLRMTRSLDWARRSVWLKANLPQLCPSLHNAFDRVQIQNAGDLQSAFFYAPDNIHWPCAACTEGIRHARISDVCVCGSWLPEPILRQTKRQPRLACTSLRRTDPMNDGLRRFSRKVIACLAQAIANVVGKPAIFSRQFG